MSGAGERISRFLTEFRMMITATGILLGFQFHATFEPRFLDQDLPMRVVGLVGLLAALVAFTALLLPAAFHRIASERHNEETFLDYARRSVGIGFLALSTSLAVSAFLYGARALGHPWGYALAGFALAVFFVGWWWFPRHIAHVSDVRPSR